MSTLGSAPALESRIDGLTNWLMRSAFPLWWARGADHRHGGYHEQLTLACAPVNAGRRARVQARQIYCYAAAGKLGWDGPWRGAVNHGLEFFLAFYLRSDGLFRTLVHPGGAAADDTAVIYDQAFALFALAQASDALPERCGELKVVARALIDALAARRLPAGGFREASSEHPAQSNPHMHLLEAALAWREIDGDPVWDSLAEDIVDLCLTKFIGPNGALHEFFAEDWSKRLDIDGRIVSPGHQFEWAWLLQRWATLRGGQNARAAARRLFDIGADHGVDRRRGVAFDEMTDDFSVHNAGARLWPQTERIKAAAILAETADTGADRTAYLNEASLGIEGLEKYLVTRIPGLWRDKMKVDGRFVSEPAPASSFYHIVCAIVELQKYKYDPR